MTKKERDKIYYEKNKAKIAERNKIKYSENKEFYSKVNKERYLKETQEQRDKRKKATLKFINNNRDIVKAKNLEYYHKNKEKCLKQVIEYHKNKRNNDSKFRIRLSLSSIISKRLKKLDESKNKSTLNMIGLENWELLKKHIESQFTEGMTWDNYGNKKDCWSIDHIIPISSAKTEEEVYKLNHYTNLRPMWHIENIKKGNK